MISELINVYSGFQLNAIQNKLVKFGRAGMPRSRYNGGNLRNALLSIPQDCI